MPLPDISVLLQMKLVRAIGANLRKWVRTNGGRETVGVVPCANPGGLSTRVGTRHDPYDCVGLCRKTFSLTCAVFNTDQMRSTSGVGIACSVVESALYFLNSAATSKEDKTCSLNRSMTLPVQPFIIHI